MPTTTATRFRENRVETVFLPTASCRVRKLSKSLNHCQTTSNRFWFDCCICTVSSRVCEGEIPGPLCLNDTEEPSVYLLPLELCLLLHCSRSWLFQGLETVWCSVFYPFLSPLYSETTFTRREHELVRTPRPQNFPLNSTPAWFVRTRYRDREH